MVQLKGNLMHTAKHTRLTQVSPAPAYICNGHMHAKRLTVTANDAGSLHTSQFLIHSGLFILQ